MSVTTRIGISSKRCLFVCLFKRGLLPNVKKVGALWAVTFLPSSPDVASSCWSSGFCQPGFFLAWSLQSRVCISGELCDGFWQGWMVSRDLALISVQMSHCFRYVTLVQHIGGVTFPRMTQWVNGTYWGTEDFLRCWRMADCAPSQSLALDAVVSYSFVWFLTTLPNWTFSRIWFLWLTSLLCVS